MRAGFGKGASKEREYPENKHFKSHRGSCMALYDQISELTYITYFLHTLLGKAVPSLPRFKGKGPRLPSLNKRSAKEFKAFFKKKTPQPGWGKRCQR